MMDLIIKHAEIFDTETGKRIYGHVGIEKGKIAGIWTGDERNLPRARKNLDIRGRYLVPGSYPRPSAGAIRVGMDADLTVVTPGKLYYAEFGEGRNEEGLKDIVRLVLVNGQVVAA